MKPKGSSFEPGSTNTPPPMVFTKLSSGAIGIGMCVKFGADQNHVTPCGAGDHPIGVALSLTSGAEQSIRITTFTGAVTMLAGSGGVAHGAYLETGASGTVVTLGAGAGVHQAVGTALADATAGSLVVVSAGLFIREI